MPLPHVFACGFALSATSGLRFDAAADGVSLYRYFITEDSFFIFRISIISIVCSSGDLYLPLLNTTYHLYRATENTRVSSNFISIRALIPLGRNFTFLILEILVTPPRQRLIDFFSCKSSILLSHFILTIPLSFLYYAKCNHSNEALPSKNSSARQFLTQPFFHRITGL
jgi:hypothetical protein